MSNDPTDIENVFGTSMTDDANHLNHPEHNLVLGLPDDSPAIKGVISFDLDGVLANFTRGFTRIGTKLFGTPTSDAPAQESWMFEDVPALGLTKEMVGHPIKGGGMWAEVINNPYFWANLDPFNVSIMHTINRIKNKVFITNRLGIKPLEQSVMFLERWGINEPRVIVAADKGPVAIEEKVVAHIDDYYPNCTAIANVLPSCYTALLYVPYSKLYLADWQARGGEVVVSVDHFVQECIKRNLVEWDANA